MNEHTFFEWKRSERLTAALALAFCLLGLGLLPGAVLLLLLLLRRGRAFGAQRPRS